MLQFLAQIIIIDCSETYLHFISIYIQLSVVATMSYAFRGAIPHQRPSLVLFNISLVSSNLKCETISWALWFIVFYVDSFLIIREYGHHGRIIPTPLLFFSLVLLCPSIKCNYCFNWHLLWLPTFTWVLIVWFCSFLDVHDTKL